MLALLTTALAFNLPTTQLGRREALVAAGAAVLAPLPAFADGAASETTTMKAKAKYGARLYKLSKASAAEILADKNAITLYASAVGRAGGPRIAKEAGIVDAGKAAIAAAKKGDTAAAQASIKTVRRSTGSICAPFRLPAPTHLPRL